MLRAFILAGLALLCFAGPSEAALISWNTWTSDDAGSLTVGPTAVDVTFTTANTHFDVPNYPSWTPTTTWADGVVVGNAPVAANGIMYLVGESGTEVNTLTFSTPVVDPVIAIWSLGDTNRSVSFVFDQTPTFVADGPSAEFGGSSIIVVGNTVSGREDNGSVQFLGTYSVITWTNPDPERFFGFNVGVAGVAPAAVPEPASVGLLLCGAAGLLGYARRRRAGRA